MDVHKIQSNCLPIYRTQMKSVCRNCCNEASKNINQSTNILKVMRKIMVPGVFWYIYMH